MSETVELNAAQRQRAQAILTRLDRGEVKHPLHVLDAWKSVQETTDYWGNQPGPGADYSRERRYVPVAEIAGTIHQDVTDPDTFVPRRLRKVLTWLLNGEFESEHQNPPILEKVQGEYYVSSNGNHRTIAFIALDIDRLFADLIEGPLS